MTVTASRIVRVTYSSDRSGVEQVAAADNAVSIATDETVTLASGANTITVPVSGSNLPTAVTIVPPSGNSTSITLKGVTGDTGIRIHNTDPTSLALHSGVTSFVLTAGAEITGVRLIWS